MDGGQYSRASTILLLALLGALAGWPGRAQTRPPAPPPPITWRGHIGPLVHRACSPCHRPGQSAPFSLLTYQDVASRAHFVAYVTGLRYMPPWRADPTYRHLRAERRLSDPEIALIRRWVEQGAPEGPATVALAPPNFPPTSGLGRPDLRLRLARPFRLRGINRDTVVDFVLPFALAADTNVRALEVVPGTPRAVHHVNTKVIDLADVPPGHEFTFMQPDSVADRGLRYYDGWVPGAQPRVWPPGFGFRLPRRGVVLLQIHYAPLAADTVDQSWVNIFFTDKRATRVLEVVNIGSNGGVAEPEPALVLAPNAVQTHRVRATTTQDLTYLYLNPHLHRLGRHFVAYALTPTCDTIRLVRIANWNYRWQDFYQLEHLLKIPAGSEIVVEATFDNTNSNPDQPFSPPRQVVQGPNSSDEMLSLIITSVPYREGDECIELGPAPPVAARPPE